MKNISAEKLRDRLEILYRQYNRKAFVDPDPLLFLYDFPDVRDREIAGLIAASLAYGRVQMIMTTVRAVLEKIGPDLHGFVTHTHARELNGKFKGFRYRFASQDHLVALILGLRRILQEYGSIEACFLAGAWGQGRQSEEPDILKGLAQIHGAVNEKGRAGHLLADPGKSSACKRSHLFLRWMVRKDQVDPGGWESVSPAHLVVPIDTHMYRIGSLLGFSRRNSPDKTCAKEITRGFRHLVPEDPVRYDFALTRFGIRQQFDVDDLNLFLQRP